MDDIIEIYRKDPKQEDVEDLNFNSEEDAQVTKNMSQFYLETRDEVHDQEGGRSDCSVGFMFICMLHLANEKNGKIAFEKGKSNRKE